MRHGRIGVGIILGLCSVAALATSVPAGEDTSASADTVLIGMPQSLFRDVPMPIVQMLMGPFRKLMHDQTGLNGQVVTVPDALTLGRQLHDDKVQLGVFHGFEFAWAQEKYPDLRPLCIAINEHRHVFAYLVVREDSTAKQIADLKGTAVALPVRSKEHCRLFLQKQCAAFGQQPGQFFSKIVASAHVEAGLDDVLRGKVQAAVVDNVALECYESVKPGCHARLKVFLKSEVFPAAVVAYHHGAVDQATLKRFKDGMITANQNERGRELMTMWQLTAFEDIPEDYDRTLVNIRKTYPAPTSNTPEKVSRPASALAP
jgi:ABC-type phosphate/phosphonate transport system substrate-binding protein